MPQIMHIKKQHDTRLVVHSRFTRLSRTELLHQQPNCRVPFSGCEQPILCTQEKKKKGIKSRLRMPFNPLRVHPVGRRWQAECKNHQACATPAQCRCWAGARQALGKRWEGTGQALGRRWVRWTGAGQGLGRRLAGAWQALGRCLAGRAGAIPITVWIGASTAR